MEQEVLGNDICIVGLGAVLPESRDVAQFWQHVLRGTSLIKELPNSRWKKDLYYSSDGHAEDKTYSTLAGYVDDTIIDAIAHDLDLPRQKYNRLKCMALAATQQALNQLHYSEIPREKISLYLGCMDTDDIITSQGYLINEGEDLKNYIAKEYRNDTGEIFKMIGDYFKIFEADSDTVALNLFTSSVLHAIKNNYGFKGEAGLIDAACASSLAAIDVSMQMLKSYKTDLVITGGIESNLSPETFVLFSKVGALGDEICAPFDKRSKGLNQGEGSVIFVLQRLEDALKYNNTIFGILKSCGSSSDGRSASLFQPSVKGQIRAFTHAYNDISIQQVDYIECHGTGTYIGDTTELQSLIEFFGDQRIPIGSVKALVGHTKGAAGAVGLLKCVLSMHNKIIPPSPYFEQSVITKSHAPFVNTEAISLEDKKNPLTFGISSFGFGGINYHLVLQEYRADDAVNYSFHPHSESHNVVVVGHTSFTNHDFNTNADLTEFNIPPNSINHIDPLQLQALYAVSELAKDLHINFNTIDRMSVSVISASILGLDCAVDFSYRLKHFEFIDALKTLEPDVIRMIVQHKNKHEKITEDTGPGVLNNVTAGRIANYFNFCGSNFNVDVDFNSLPLAINIATEKLAHHSGMAIIIAAQESFESHRIRIQRNGIHCLFLASLEYAKKYNLPIKDTINHIRYGVQKNEQ